jgi:hypothetical protein
MARVIASVLDSAQLNRLRATAIASGREVHHSLAAAPRARNRAEARA